MVSFNYDNYFNGLYGVKPSLNTPAYNTLLEKAKADYFNLGKGAWGQEQTTAFNNWINGNSGSFGNFISNLNLNDLASGLSAIGSVMDAFTGYKNYKLNVDQLQFAKDAWLKNYVNSIKSYNEALWDKYRSRGSMESGSTNKYLDEYNSAKL